MTDRQTTHAPGCWSWGPKHYECAVREIEALRADLAQPAEGWEVLDDADPLMALDECAKLLETQHLMVDVARCEVAAKNARAAMRRLTTPPASQEQAQQPSPQAWANETGLRQIECPSCGDLAVAYDPQQPSPATPADMAVYQSIADGYTKAQQPMCECGDRPADQCAEQWGPECDLGNNEACAKVVQALKQQATTEPVQAVDERAAFEDWAKARSLPLDGHGGHYSNIRTRNNWLGWQARASQHATTEPDEDDDKWRDVALRFDKHRMQALWHLQAMLKDPEKHADIVRQFLKDPTHPDAEAILPPPEEDRDHDSGMEP